MTNEQIKSEIKYISLGLVIVLGFMFLFNKLLFDFMF